eukprot:c21860_g3_i1 orf=330-1538(-)
MAHGGHGKRSVSGKPTHNTKGGNKGLDVRNPAQIKKETNKKKTKMGSIKNRIRSIERLLKKNPSVEVKNAQHKLLEDLKKQGEEHQRAELERKMSLRYRRVKFFERRKIERSIKRLEKLQEAGADMTDNAATEQKLDITEQLAQLKEDLEYVRFFPKTEKYVSLFVGNDDEEVITKRSKLRQQIKANMAAAAAAGVEPEEMANNEDQAMEVSDDDFFLAGSSSDEAETDDKCTPTRSKPGAARDCTSKKPAMSSARHTIGHKNHQQRQRLQSSGSDSQVHNQRPQSSGSNYKNKIRDQRHRMTGGENENKKQKTMKISSPSSDPLPSYSRSLQGKSQPASNTTFRTASSVQSSSNNAGLSNVPSSYISSDIIKAPTIPEVGSSDMDAQKKRRRKHRPKKKKA